ncbi:MAG: hypothetical protein FK734_06890 [Asgard group archaeon]|nr:hypothetical protein [Asgard group archaeon]
MVSKRTHLGAFIATITIVGLVYLIIFVSPIIRSKQINNDTNYSSHTWSEVHYKIDLLNGHTYTIHANTGFWAAESTIYVYKNSLLLNGQKMTITGSYGYMPFTATKTGTYYIVYKVSDSAFYDFEVLSTSLPSSSTVSEVYNSGKLVIFLLPILLAFIIYFVAIGLSKVNSSSLFKFRTGTSPIYFDQSIATTPETIRHIPARILKSPEERVKDLKSIIKRYKSISLDEMAQLLQFGNTIELQDWLIDLPSELNFQIDRGYVIIPENLQKDTSEASDAISEIANNLYNFQAKTCFYCGTPLKSDSKYCLECGKEIVFCSVCKLPISFGDEIGKCVFCEVRGHYSHLMEWMKVKGTCPTCMKKWPADGIINITEKVKK